MVSDYYSDTDYLSRLTLRRLAELNRTKAKVEALEKRAGLLAEYELERKKLDVLTRLQDQYGSISPALSDATFAITELKAQLQAVYDADVLLDRELQALTSQHAVSYAVRVLDRMSEPSRYALEGSAGVLELASSSLCMFSQRAGAGDYFSEANSVPVLVKLLSPLYPPIVVINISNTVGNMSSDLDFRVAFRSAGGVGALVRLLRPDCESAVQAAAASGLSLLSSRDLVVQDSVRYLGGLDLLVDLLVTGDAYTAETARYCLLALRQGNTRNQADIISAIRANGALLKNVRRLDLASELLRFEEAPRLHSSYRPALPAPEHVVSRSSSRSKSASRSQQLRSSCTELALRSSLRPASSRYNSILSKSTDFGAASTALTSATHGKYVPPPAITATVLAEEMEDMKLTVPDLDSALLRRKHLVRFSAEELQLLLSEIGFDRLDLRPFRLNAISGLDLLDMTEEEMAIRLLLPTIKIRKLRAVQRAVALFDRIATVPRQGRLSEIELRLYLAGHGCAVHEVDKVVKLFKSLVRTDKLDFVTFWDFVVGFDWIAQAFKIYHVPV
uniref:SAM domain-containing protein n=1 Tax=Polytomella parva TaxID=51329 RepID=A0A7S0UYY4_9CHLO|mmetsp:Transcript_22956/g.40558  ORF Transcript_22956/g.40558 Transcript_22956/m.40558 type:complete len:560 (+) Transcript_22956:104-1783(+)|eukprot:CAMPEP_0175051494 /NCGR_PEP_ID=MMETSP0052_2-20121109/7835_1 /TAXON_ID=51329 ORGANISM="Polytomella parva, Strain SAG 63-3" /NCGR_SAMPLE_ID=MMETSP0052_2 /ASSEMBLY_ACC=CAM_ASM_000194 /LENGTH=559 /DNA_ID=CAMNT_0016315793 /DNA_START=83 /DNA_END=1762 /DNA_ORIENTATION=-